MNIRMALSGISLVPWLMIVSSHAQVVRVTAQLDTNTIAVGQGTTLRIYAQVLPAYVANSEQIFSWYVDVLNTNGTAATANYASMLKPTSDKDPLVSSNGFTSGANRLAIYDTFLNLPGAGTNPPVELLRIPVTGLAAGQTRLGVRHGTGAPSLSQDFIVAPLDGGEMMTGGDYSAATVNLTVVSAPSNFITCLTVTYTRLSGGSNKAMLQYCPLAGYDNFVEYRDQLTGGAGWLAFPGGPRNSGVYNDTNSVPVRFYRIRAAPAGSSLAPFRVAIAPTDVAGQLRLTYPVAAGYNFTVEFRNSLVIGSWQPLSGAPHNSGNLIVTNNGVLLFFRVNAVPQGP